jgi:hypothetical protein
LELRVDEILAFGLLPGGLYLLLEKFVLRGNTTVMGARYVTTTKPEIDALIRCSVWVFLLLASEAIKTQKTNPNFRYILPIPPKLPY